MLTTHQPYPPMQLTRLQHWWSTHSQATQPLAIKYVTECESTNGQLYNSAHSHNTLLVTERQTSGKGQFERAWVSGSGDLTFSLGLTLDASQLVGLSLRAGLALTQVFTHHQLTTQLKWANDVIATHPDTAQRGKLAGILVQTLAMPNGQYWTVIGVGVNISSRLLPQHVHPSAFAPIGLAQLSAYWNDIVMCDRESLLMQLVDTILVQIETAHINHDLPTLWNPHDLWQGQQVMLTDPQNQTHIGMASGIDSSGAYQLLIDGQLQSFTSGQLRPVP